MTTPVYEKSNIPRHQRTCVKCQRTGLQAFHRTDAGWVCNATFSCMRRELKTRVTVAAATARKV